MEQLRKRKEEMLAEAKSGLQDLLSWSDELPEGLIIADPKFQRHKFRGNWFQGVCSDLTVVALALRDKVFLAEIYAFMELKASRVNALTTREEILGADRLIMKALEKLQNNS